MEVRIKGKNLPVTDALHEHAQRKLEKLTRFLPPWDEPPDVELELSVERNPSIELNQVCEVTVRTKGPVLRVRENDRDMYVAIDHAVHKLERQAARYRDRKRRRHHRHGKHDVLPEHVLPKDLEDVALAEEAEEVAALNGAAEVVDEPVLRVVKAKRFEMIPMSIDDAADRIEMLSHDFYVFKNTDDSDAVTVIYRRRDGDLGLIAPSDGGHA
jgi:putative sigma-54 modulation protein